MHEKVKNAIYIIMLIIIIELIMKEIIHVVS